MYKDGNIFFNRWEGKKISRKKRAKICRNKKIKDLPPPT